VTASMLWEPNTFSTTSVMLSACQESLQGVRQGKNVLTSVVGTNSDSSDAIH
jgi:hypothetical protein